jgi:hypothetical protein
MKVNSAISGVNFFRRQLSAGIRGLANMLMAFLLTLLALGCRPHDFIKRSIFLPCILPCDL